MQFGRDRAWNLRRKLTAVAVSFPKYTFPFHSDEEVLFGRDWGLLFHVFRILFNQIARVLPFLAYSAPLWVWTLPEDKGCLGTRVGERKRWMKDANLHWSIPTPPPPPVSGGQNSQNCDCYQSKHLALWETEWDKVEGAHIIFMLTWMQVRPDFQYRAEYLHDSAETELCIDSSPNASFPPPLEIRLTAGFPCASGYMTCWIVLLLFLKNV